MCWSNTATTGLIRPRADYTGKPVGEKWIPISERKTDARRVSEPVAHA